MTETQLLTGIFNILTDIKYILVAFLFWLVIKLVYRLFNIFF